MLCYLWCWLCFLIKKSCYFIRQWFACLFHKHHKHKGKYGEPLDPALIPKFETQLTKPPAFSPFVCKIGFSRCFRKPGRKWHFYFVEMRQFTQQMLPKGFPKTKVWGYAGLIKDPKTGRRTYAMSSPGPTFEAVRDIPATVKWINKIKGPHLFPVDPTLHWANPNRMKHPHKPWPPFPPGFRKAQKPVPLVTHLHGGEVPPAFDGHPDAWFTRKSFWFPWCRKKGPAYKTSLYTYPNTQNPTTLWYHDHALGITRLNVYAGLAGFYLLRNPKKEHKSGHNPFDFQQDGERYVYQDPFQCSEHKGPYPLPSGPYEIPLVIQDKSFYTDGSLAFPTTGNNPNIHPYWQPEFFGNTITVNGKVWPNLDVERRQYRFRILNGSNARFYNLRLSNGMPFIQIGTDGGFLPKPVELTSLLLAPAERADILIDFSCIEPGTKIVLLNDANAPYPDGNPPDPDTTGQIMQFTVPALSPMPVKPPRLPKRLNVLPPLQPDSPKRVLTLVEEMGPDGPVRVLLNGQPWSAPVTEKAKVGSTEEWWLVNLTADTHPIHLHLVQFQLYNRQNFNVEEYTKKWEEVNGMPPADPPTVVPVEPYLVGPPIPPDPNEMGWKDTIRANPGQVTRIRVRFAPQSVPPCFAKPGMNLFPFDPTAKPGYVWHCHILDHEDNEMMRPYQVEP